MAQEENVRRYWFVKWRKEVKLEETFWQEMVFVCQSLQMASWRKGPGWTVNHTCKCRFISPRMYKLWIVSLFRIYVCIYLRYVRLQHLRKGCRRFSEFSLWSDFSFEETRQRNSWSVKCKQLFRAIASAWHRYIGLLDILQWICEEK